MNSQDLYNTLFAFIENPQYTAILIDGPWGCGKSYQMQLAINEYNNLKNNDAKKNKIVMASVFGFESIDEIHTNLYTKLYPIKIKAKNMMKKTFGIISKTMDLIPNASLIPTDIIKNLTETAMDCIENDKKEEIHPDTIIVLDDIERLSKKISYQDFYGYISKLILQGIKIVCICNSLKITNKKNKEFMNFKEKIFERVYEINEPLIEVIRSKFKNYKGILSNQIIDEFKLNIRFANKVYIFFDEVITNLNKYYKNYTEKYSYELFLICCINVIKEEFPSENNNEIKCDENGSEELTKCLKSIYLYNDYSKIDSLLTFYKMNIQNEYPEILKEQFFLLSDSRKENYIEQFLRILSNKSIKWNFGLSNAFREILMFSNYVFTDEDINKITLCINRSNIFEDEKDLWLLETFNSLNGDKYNDTINKIKVNLKKYKCKNLKDNLKKLYQNKKYFELTNYVYDLEQKPTEDINDEIKFIKDNNYFFPNIEGDIKGNEWQYCIELSHFLRKDSPDNKDYKDYLAYLDSLIKKNPDNYSFNNRIEILKSERSL